jgi:protein-S-isoprenylcysteine O-methyltransferase Ste14
MYLAEIALWLGWSILFGSVAVLLGCLLVCIGAGLLAPREERALALKFGAAYQSYKATVPRWLGKWWV